MADQGDGTAASEVARLVSEAFDKAATEYRGGADEVEIGVGFAVFKISNHNDDRETTHLSIDGLGELLRAAHANGAVMAAVYMASIVADLAGLRVVTQEADHG